MHEARAPSPLIPTTRRRLVVDPRYRCRWRYLRDHRNLGVMQPPEERPRRWTLCGVGALEIRRRDTDLMLLSLQRQCQWWFRCFRCVSDRSSCLHECRQDRTPTGFGWAQSLSEPPVGIPTEMVQCTFGPCLCPALHLPPSQPLVAVPTPFVERRQKSLQVRLGSTQEQPPRLLV